MKKIIAAAVTAAFIAPVAIADVSIGGKITHVIVDESVVGNAAGGTRQATEQYFGISAASEGNNGVSISAYMGFNGSGGADGGDSIKLAHPSFGSVAIGDVSSAPDALDDKTEVLQLIDPVSGNGDADVLWTLPTMVDGLTVTASYAAENADDNPADAFSSFNMGLEGNDGAGDDANGLAFAYQAGPVRFAYGTNDEGAEDNTWMGVQAEFAGVMVAYETNEQITTAGVETDHTSMALTYDMGDVTFMYMATDSETDAGVVSNDHTGYGVTYDLGGGAKVLVERGTDDDAGSNLDEYTALGLMYAF